MSNRTPDRCRLQKIPQRPQTAVGSSAGDRARGSRRPLPQLV